VPVCAARSIAGKLLGMVVLGVETCQVVEMLTQLCTSFAAENGGVSHKFEERSGSLTAAGYVLAQCATGASGFPLPRRTTEFRQSSLPELCRSLAEMFRVVRY